MKKLLKNKSGEAFIDVAVMILCSMMVIVLALNTFSFFGIRSDLDHYAKEMIRTASASGRTAGAEITQRRDELNDEIGRSPAVTFTAEHFNNTQRTVQFGDTITVTLTYTTQFHGFGVFSIPVTVTSRHSGLSQRYWK